jgi:hypothetical protein
MRAPSVATRRGTAELLRQVLELVDDGALDASSPQARRMVRRIEGAVAALDPEPA